MERNNSDIFREDGGVLAGLPGFCWKTCEMSSQLNRMELTSLASEFNLGKTDNLIHSVKCLICEISV